MFDLAHMQASERNLHSLGTQSACAVQGETQAPEFAAWAGKRRAQIHFRPPRLAKWVRIVVSESRFAPETCRFDLQHFPFFSPLRVAFFLVKNLIRLTIPPLRAVPNSLIVLRCVCSGCIGPVLALPQW